MVENEGLRGQAVEMRRRDPGVAVAAEMILPERVGDDHNDVQVIVFHRIPPTTRRRFFSMEDGEAGVADVNSFMNVHPRGRRG